MDNFEEYLRQGEPNKAEKAKVWKTAIGLQQVDGLKPSSYLIKTAKQNIEGDITIEEVKQRIDSYYKQQPVKDYKNRTEEADKVSARITEILGEMHIQYLDTVNDTVNDTVFELMKRNNKITATEISEHLNISLSTAKRKIKKLKENGIIERVGSDKTGCWKIIDSDYFEEN